MKKVLVLMATYNGEKYLEKQIDSILNQKNIDVSLLIRDDGSTDNTKKIIQRKMKLESKISLLEADAEDSHGAMINYYKLLCIAQTTVASRILCK
ncbi:glycosyltransferase [Latilactobacillus curvatus]|uniref:glycosyltransferase n=1 Tax=Latilactobacillus curvatus TaxID=28038 RepID=UPI0011BB834B|nr:glycosyltransferase [Latilactobacillus curvatus]QEA48570.1 glycosyltransferase [Latilactobacillus curvatus]